MTIKEAFAQAFDEAFVMDALPSMGLGSKNPNPAASGVQKNPAKASGMGGDSGSGATTSGDMMTLAEHDEKNHPEGYKGGKCSWRDSHGMSGMTLEEAQRKGLADKRFPSQEGQQPIGQPQPSGNAQPTPEELKAITGQTVAALNANPSAALEMPSHETPPEPHSTEEGIIVTTSTGQAADVEYLEEKKENGTEQEKDAASDALSQLSAITKSEMPQKEGIVSQGESHQESIGGESGQIGEQTAQVKTITTSDGKSSREIEPDEAMVLAANPEKKEIFQKMVDIEGMVGDLKEDSPQFEDLANQYQALQRMFFGADGGREDSNGEGTRNGQMHPKWPPRRRDSEFFPSPTDKSPSNTTEVDGGTPPTEEDTTPKRAARKSDYIDALDQMHEAEIAYYQGRHNIREAKDYDAAVKAAEDAKKEWEEAKAKVAEFEDASVDIVDNDGNAIDTGADRRLWAEQERVIRNAGGDDSGDSGEGGDGGGPKKLCPICSTPLKVDGSCPKQDEPWHKEKENSPEDEGTGGGGGNPPSSPPNTPPNTPPSNPPSTTRGETPAQHGTQTPSDEKFRIGKNKYKIGGTVYTDVSGKGLLRTMLSSFMAGLRGEGIITGWDRISGAWDQMKRSENGEMVRDGISGALIKNTISNYAVKEGLSDDAKMELSVIQDMISQAKSPKDTMAAVKQFQAWKEKYSKELGEMDKPKLGEPFKPLPNDYKGGKPPISILDPPKDFDADKAFGDHVATVLQKSLGAQGSPVGDIESISVGPSATTIEFKVDPTFNITEAKSKKVLETLHGALGSPVSNVSWVNGKPHVIAVQVTNKKMRDVSFSACIASDEWKNFAEKAGLPVTLGKDSSGKNVNLDLAKQPHTIVTGESGSGKSVFLMAAINSLEMAKTPDEARLVLLDPKNEFRSQDGSPHLLYPRAQKPQDIANVVSSLKALMDDRIAKIGGAVKDFDPTKNEFQGNSDRNITEYNRIHPDEKMPHILMTFDEVASIMKNPDVSDRVKQDLSQIMALGRSVGINCLLATQRADVASIPGDIKANAPASIAFKAAPDDAKASAAAKSLAGSGDFIMTDKEGKQTRGRGCFISDKEVAAIPAYYRDNMNGAPKPTDGGGDSGGGEGPQLPQEHLDAIAAAVKKGNPISMVATEGFMDAFKNAFPSDWEITEEDVNGEKHWKASPPKTNSGEQKGNEASSIPTENVKVKSANASFPTQKELPDGEVEIPIATYAADKGYDWQGRPEGIDIEDLNAIVDAGAEKVRNSDGIIPDSFVVRLNLGNGKVAFMTETLTKSGFDQAGRSSVLNRVAFVDEEMANTNGDKIVNHLLSMPIPQKGSDPSLKDNNIKVKFEGEKEEKAHLESNEPVSSEGSGEEPQKKIEKLDDLDQSFNPTDVESMKSYRDRITDAINQLSNVTVKGKKESDALEKKLKPFKEEREWIESKIKENFPDEAYQEGEDIDNNESTEQTHGSDNDGGSISGPKPESKQKMAFVERRFERKRKELEKAQDQETDDAKASLIDDELAALTRKYEDAKAKYESGGSPEEVLKAFIGEKATSAEQVGSETTANGEANNNNSETTPQNNEEDEEKELAKKRELAPKAFRPKHGYQALTDKQIKEVTSVIPDDWEIETDNELGKPAEHETGYVFVRNPKTGSYGHVELKGKKKNGSVGPVWTPEVKTTDDMFEGETRDEKGRVKLGPKAQAARNAKTKIMELENVATKNGTSLAEEIIKYTQSPQYKGEIPEELLQRAKDGEELDWQEESNRYNTLEKRHRTGMDKAPDNMTIVAYAVAKALEKL